MLVRGLEPLRTRRRNLNPICLPIPAHQHLYVCKDLRINFAAVLIGPNLICPIRFYRYVVGLLLDLKKITQVISDPNLSSINIHMYLLEGRIQIAVGHSHLLEI